MTISVATIGFTQSTAANFFDRLLAAGVKKVIDVRLHNTSQLAGFAKADDLAYFLGAIGGIGYVHAPALAPTDAILTSFKKQKGNWSDYERQFKALMFERAVEKKFSPQDFDGSCLLCSETTPHHCHRRLVCDYFNDKWGGALAVTHL